MNTFALLSYSDIKDQIEMLHKAVTQYIRHIRETIESQKNTPYSDKNINVDTILQNLGDIKEDLIDALLSKKATDYAMHVLNVVYNFDAFLNPIATTIVTYAIHQLYINKIGVEIISNINNTIKCICMDTIARNNANKGLIDVANMSRDYNMTVSEIMRVTQKYIDSKDTQIMQMLDQTIQHDIDGFKENIESADKLIEAFSQNDKWVAEWGMTTKAITLQFANNICLKIRKDMGSYITTLSTCIDQHVVDNLRFNEEDDYYGEKHINDELNSNNKKLDKAIKIVDEAEKEKEELIEKGKELHNAIKVRKYKEFRELDSDKREALQAYWNSDHNKAPQAVRFIYDKDRLMFNLKRVIDSINGVLDKEGRDVIISKDFYLVIGDEDLRLYLYDLMDYSFSSTTEDIIKKQYLYYNADKRNKTFKLDKSSKIEILRFKYKVVSYYNILKQQKKYGTK